MNYDQPRQIACGPNAGRWHYTTMNRRTGTHAIGYCAEHEPHATKDEAYACYTRYLMTERVQLDNTLGDYNPCDAPDCAVLTNRAAQVGGWHLYRLCDVHRTREMVAQLFGTVGDSAHS